MPPQEIKRLSQQPISDKAQVSSTPKPAADVALEVPRFDSKVDYQNLYHKMFQENELLINRYDELLAEREDAMKLYKAMRRGDFSHMKNQVPPEGVQDLSRMPMAQ